MLKNIRLKPNMKKQIKIFGVSLFYYHVGEHTFWFRIFGRGLHVKNLNYNPLCFSERSGCKSYVRIGDYVIKYLEKIKE